MIWRNGSQPQPLVEKAQLKKRNLTFQQIGTSFFKVGLLKSRSSEQFLDQHLHQLIECIHLDR